MIRKTFQKKYTVVNNYMTTIVYRLPLLRQYCCYTVNSTTSA